MIPIDKIINCERVLATKQYQTVNHRSEEDLWLFKYLQGKKKSKEEIFKIWMTIYPNKYERSKDDPNPEKTFECLYKNIKGVRLKNNYHDIIIYQSEVDWINACNCNRWVKEYMILFLAYCRLKDKYTFENLPYNDLLKLTSIARYSEFNKQRIAKLFEELGMIKTEKVVTFEDMPDIDERGFQISYGGMTRVERTYRKCRFEDVDTTELEAIHLKTFADAQKCCELIKMEKVCPCCGKAFEYSNKNKTDLCPECWYKNEMIRWRVSKEIHKVAPKSETRTCAECGTEFEANGRTKRCICESCWKEEIKRKDRLRKSKKIPEEFFPGKVSILLYE